MSLFIGLNGKEKFLLPKNDLKTHVGVLGQTGSGKTALIHVLVEEAVMAGSNAIVLDPKGDLSNLFLAFPGLSPEEFDPWVLNGNPVEEANKWRSGISSTQQSYDRVKEWKESANFQIFTPGEGFSLFPSLNKPNSGNLTDHATSLVGMLSDFSDSEKIFLTEVFLYYWNNNTDISIDNLPKLVEEVDLVEIDGIGIDDFISRKERLGVAKTISSVKRKSSKWLSGPPLKIEDLITKFPTVTIFNMRHLREEEQQFFTSVFLHKLIEWMFSAKPSNELRAVCVLDEASKYLPHDPYFPPTKEPIRKLLAQGRAHGIGMILGTQNPNDLDYKALSNIGTLFIGKLKERDLKRDLQSQLESKGLDADALFSLPERSFLAITRDGNIVPFMSRWTLSYLRGPIDISELSGLNCSDSEEAETEEEPEIEENLEVHSGDIEIPFTLRDPESKPADVWILYSIDGEWKAVTPSDSCPNMTAIETSPEGVEHVFIWKSDEDVGYNDVDLCINILGKDTIYLPKITVDNKEIINASTH